MALFPQQFIDDLRHHADIVVVDPGLRVAEEGGCHLQGALSVSRREDAVVPRQPRQGLLPLLRLRRRRRRVQVPRAARKGRVPGCRQAARAALRPDAAGAGADRRSARQRRRARRRCSRCTKRRPSGSGSSLRPPLARGSGRQIADRGVTDETQTGARPWFCAAVAGRPEAGAAHSRDFRKVCCCGPVWSSSGRTGL